MFSTTFSSLIRTALTLTVVFGLSLTGCKSLVEEPDFASPDAFYKTEKDMQAAVNAAYRPFSSQWFNTYYNRSVFECALGISGGYEKGPQYYEQGSYAASDEYISAYWQDVYNGVNRTNVVLDQLSKISKDALPDASKKQMSGEAHFLRAMYYYHVFAYFENIPVTDKPTAGLGQYASNEGGKQKALDLMTADLKAAEGELPTTYAASDAGRPTRWAAKALLAKVLLEAGKNQEAADKAQEVITQSGLKLFANYNDNFSADMKNQGERLFEIQNNFDKSPWDNYNNMHAHYTPTDWDGGDPNTLTVGDGVTAAGWGDAWIVGDTKVRALFAETDKRTPVTFMSQYRSKNAAGAVVKYSPTAKSAFVAQGSPERSFNNVILQKFIEYNTGGWQNTKKNYIVLRLADTYLVHAEAVANGATGNGLASLNAVRQRAGIASATALTKDGVMTEWMREFIGEGWIFPTVRRFNKTAEVIKEYANGRVVDNAKWRVLPIPFVEINANPNVKQNTGWGNGK